METKIVNTAAGTAMSSHASTPRKNLIRYRMSLAILNTMLHEGELSEADHVTAQAVLACHYGLERDSIFR